MVVFSKTHCPHSKAAKALFGSMNVDARVIELDLLENGAEVQSALLEITGQKTVPNVFIKGKHLGGNDATQAAAKSGKLEEMMVMASPIDFAKSEIASSDVSRASFNWSFLIMYHIFC